MRSFCLKILLFSVLMFIVATPVLADAPFMGYSYDYWGRLIPAPAAYVPVRTFVAGDICESLGEFNNPVDIHVCADELIYIVDRDNNRIVVFDRYLNLNRVIDSFMHDGVRDTFNLPSSVFVTAHGNMYIADTQNYRIVTLDADDNFVRMITAPDVEGLEDGFAFLPTDVVVGRSGRVLVIVARVFEGMMSFDADGEFIGYFGTIPVNASPIEILWRFFMTQEQRAQQQRFIPTEFQSMAIDQYGFILTTNLQPWASDDQVMRLNPRGDDVLVNFNDNVNINGDQFFRPAGAWLSGPSQFIDIIARPFGKYSTLDSTRGRVYTYDNEGNLLYVFSGMGTLQGMTNRPIAIEAIGDSIMVLDEGRGRVVYFEPTEYGRLINAAIAARHIGDEAGAVNSWRQLAAIDENFSMAWVGIGRSKLAVGDNVSAMYYLTRGMDMHHYSIAFRRHRIDVMHGALPGVLTGGLVLAVLIVGLKTKKWFKNRGREDEND